MCDRTDINPFALQRVCGLQKNISIPFCLKRFWLLNVTQFYLFTIYLSMYFVSSMFLDTFFQLWFPQNINNPCKGENFRKICEFCKFSSLQIANFFSVQRFKPWPLKQQWCSPLSESSECVSGWKRKRLKTTKHVILQHPLTSLKGIISFTALSLFNSFWGLLLLSNNQISFLHMWEMKASLFFTKKEF